MRLISSGFGVLCVGAAIGLIHCGGSTTSDASNPGSDGGVVGDGGGHPPIGEVPLKHFPAGATCRSTRPAGQNNDDGGKTCDADAGAFCQCGSDSECTDGTNGRCIITGNGGPHCTYDACSTSADCTGANTSCACGDVDPSSYNVCVPSNCKVDTDCGSNGYCSPSLGSCGTYGGEYGGVYCHTANDECVNDSDCSDGGRGFCAFDTEAAKWSCQYTVCAG